MAIYTEISEDDLTPFLAEYGLKGPASLTPIMAGVTNSNYRLTHQGTDYAFTVLEPGITETETNFCLSVMTHAAANGVRCPVPQLRSIGAGYLTKLKNKPALIVSWLDGENVIPPGLMECVAIGRALAEFHLAMADFTQTRPNPLGSSAWLPMLEMVPAEVVTKLLGCEAAEVRAAITGITARWPSRLPIGVIHADLFPDNVLFKANQKPGLIDFYYACTDAMAYDLAILLNAWAFADITKAKGLLSGYESVRPLNEMERAAIPVLCQGAALRFMLTRLRDWFLVSDSVKVNKLDPLEYWQKYQYWAAHE